MTVRELIDHETTELLAALDQMAIRFQFQHVLTRFPDKLAVHYGRWRCVIQHGGLAYDSPYGAHTFKADTRKEVLTKAVAWIPEAAAEYEQEVRDEAHLG